MSIMNCKGCGDSVDTDFDTEKLNDVGFCEACGETQVTEIKPEINFQPSHIDAIFGAFKGADWLLDPEVGEILARMAMEYGDDNKVTTI